jgi:hypothetical protein
MLRLDFRTPIRICVLGLTMAIFLKSIPGHAFGPESHKSFVSDSGQAIDSVCVVVSYQKISGVAVGPDGKGGHLSTERFLLRPFRYSSTENFYGKADMNGSILIPIPPFFAIGRGYVTGEIVFLKPGFLPLDMSGSYSAKSETLTLRSDTTKQADKVVEALLKRDTHSSLLRSFFISTSSKRDAEAATLVIDYTPEEDELLRSCILGDSSGR